MALSRSFLKGMGLTEEQVEAITQANAESLEAVKAQRDEYKEKANQVDELKNELDELKANDWKTKYEKEHADFESYKSAQDAKEITSKKEAEYVKLLRELKVNEKRINGILKLANLESIELDDNGAIKNADELSEKIKKEWEDFIPTEETVGARTEQPTGANTGSYSSKEEIMKIKDPTARQKAIMENANLFGY